MERASAGVNYFCIATATRKDDTTETPVADFPRKNWSSLADDPRSITSTLKEITGGRYQASREESSPREMVRC